MEGGVAGAPTVMFSCLELEPPALVVVTVGVKTPSAVGMPLIVPVEEPRVNPEGRAPPGGQSVTHPWLPFNRQTGTPFRRGRHLCTLCG